MGRESVLAMGRRTDFLEEDEELDGDLRIDFWEVEDLLDVEFDFRGGPVKQAVVCAAVAGVIVRVMGGRWLDGAGFLWGLSLVVQSVRLCG